MKSQFKTQTYIFMNARGASLILVMCMVALISLVGVGLISFHDMYYKQVQSDNARLELQSLNTEIRNFLTNEVLCTKVLGGKDHRDPTPVVLASHLQSNQNYGSHLRIDKLEMGWSMHADDSTTIMNGDVIANISGRSSILGGSLFKKKFPVSFEIDAGGNITRCYLRINSGLLCKAIGGAIWGFAGCSLVHEDDCLRWGGQISYEHTNPHRTKTQDWRWDPLNGPVVVREIDDFGFDTRVRCNFCGALGGINIGTTCVANDYPADKIGIWEYAGDTYYRCAIADTTKYRDCRELDQKQKCAPIGSKEECFTSWVVNKEPPGNELCVFRSMRCR